MWPMFPTPILWQFEAASQPPDRERPGSIVRNGADAMAFFYRAHMVRAERRVMPWDEPATPCVPARRSFPTEDGLLPTVWLTVALLAMLAATFGLSCLAYSHLAADSRRATQGPLGELWNGVLP